MRTIQQHLHFLKRLSLLAMLAALIGITGCASKGPSALDKIENQGDIAPLEVRNVLMAAQGDVIRINVEVFNSSSEAQNFQYRVRWVNADGFQIWDDEPWKTEIIYGKERRMITAIAPTPKAADFRFVITRAKRGV